MGSFTSLRCQVDSVLLHVSCSKRLAWAWKSRGAKSDWKHETNGPQSHVPLTKTSPKAALMQGVGIRTPPLFGPKAWVQGK